MNNLEFALEMKNKRLASGLSQGELASLTHVSRYSINRFENGKANASKETQNIILRCLNYYVCDKPLLWSSIFVTLMANKIGGLQFGIYRNCQISSRVFHTAVAALPLTKANRSDFE